MEIPKHLKKFFTPALLVYSKKEAEEKLSFIKENYPDAHLHVDVTDTKFVISSFWCKAHDIKNLNIKNSFEAHLMTFHPEKRISAWKRAGARRIIFHYEATNRPLRVIDTIKKHGLEACVALNLETSPNMIELLVAHLDAILCMGIAPGRAGQPFHSEVIRKINILHKKYPKKLIIVDGGVSAENAPLLIEAGARQLVSTSAVYGRILPVILS